MNKQQAMASVLQALMPPPAARVLAALLDHGEARQGELAELLGMTPTKVKDGVKWLAREGFVIIEEQRTPGLTRGTPAHALRLAPTARKRLRGLLQRYIGGVAQLEELLQEPA